MVRSTTATERTIEDQIAESDDDYPSNTDGSKSARYPWSYVGDDVPEDMHARRAESVLEGEANDPRNYRGGDE